MMLGGMSPIAVSVSRSRTATDALAALFGLAGFAEGPPDGIPDDLLEQYRDAAQSSRCYCGEYCRLWIIHRPRTAETPAAVRTYCWCRTCKILGEI